MIELLKCKAGMNNIVVSCVQPKIGARQTLYNKALSINNRLKILYEK